MVIINTIAAAPAGVYMDSKLDLTFKDFLISLNEGSPLVDNYCNFIKDSKQKAACEKLYKKTPKNITYGGGFGSFGGGAGGGGGA